MQNKHSIRKKGFTIVELLIVIVVIAILAAITIVAYNGIQSSAAVSVLKSDLKNASTQLEVSKVRNKGGYQGDESTLPRSEGTNFEYSSTGDSYCLSATSERAGDKAFHISSATGSIKEGVCDGHATPGEPVVATNSSCFAFDAGTGAITKYYDNEGDNAVNPACPRDVVIPSRIDGVEVIVLGDFSFANMGESPETLGDNPITSVIIPGTVTILGVGVFAATNLTSIVIPPSITSISEMAFAISQLSSINIPSSVTSIGKYAFNSSQLASINIPNSVTSIDEGAFMYTKQLTSISIPNSITEIRMDTFNGSALASVTIPNSVTIIEQYAFSEANLTSLSIPNSVTYIGTYAFYDNELTSVVIPASVDIIGGYSFMNNQLTSVTIPTSVTGIGAEAFANNQLTSVTIPSTASVWPTAFDDGVTINYY